MTEKLRLSSFITAFEITEPLNFYYEDSVTNGSILKNSLIRYAKQSFKNLLGKKDCY